MTVINTLYSSVCCFDPVLAILGGKHLLPLSHLKMKIDLIVFSSGKNKISTDMLVLKNNDNIIMP